MRKYSYFLKAIIQGYDREFEYPLKIYSSLAYAKKHAEEKNIKKYRIYRSEGFMYDDNPKLVFEKTQEKA